MVAYISMPIGKKRTQSKQAKQPTQTLLNLQTRFNTLGLYRPKIYIWRCKARLQKYMEEYMRGGSPRIWDKPRTPVFFPYMNDQPSAFPTYPPFPLLGSPMSGWNSSSLQGGQAAVSSPIAGWNSPSMQGGQAAVSSPMPRADSHMTSQLPVDWVSSPTSPGWKVPRYAKWPNDLV